MNTNHLERQFEAIGARIAFREHRRRSREVRIDIRTDRKGECFEVTVDSDWIGLLRVIDRKPDIRHLLLMFDATGVKQKYLCGHDERHWFVAAIPETASAANVYGALEALKPKLVLERQARLRVSCQRWNERRNEAFVRQGEWFFVPLPAGTGPDESVIFRNEPIRRGNGKPHVCEELVRIGGELVYVSRQHPNGITEKQYQRLIRQEPELKRMPWRTFRRNPDVLIRGTVRHPDHKTITLKSWHRVLMNTETQALAMQHVAFLD